MRNYSGVCEFGLADVLGVDGTGVHHGRSGAADPSWETWTQHTYRLAEGVVGRGACLLVADQEAKLSVDDGWAAFELGSILDHEVVVVT